MIQEVVYSPLGLNTGAHSVPLSTILETGILGMVLVLIAWLAPIFNATQLGHPLSVTNIAVIALLMGLFVHQAFDSSIFRYHWAHFIFVYLLGASAGLSGSRTSE